MKLFYITHSKLYLNVYSNSDVWGRNITNGNN